MIKSRRMIWMGYVARTGEKRNAYKVLVEKRERKRPYEIYRRSWQNIIGWEGVDSSDRIGTNVGLLYTQ
jgi:hypothetical protein